LLAGAVNETVAVVCPVVVADTAVGAPGAVAAVIAEVVAAVPPETAFTPRI
jgi:hypothetical protein